MKNQTRAILFIVTLPTVQAAEQGHALAMANLGLCYANGNGVKQDYQQAVEWYRKAAEQGNALAEGCLGWCYKYGNGVKQDYKLAAEWYRKSAEKGHATSQYNLGVCYEKAVA